MAALACSAMNELLWQEARPTSKVVLASRNRESEIRLSANSFSLRWNSSSALSRLALAISSAARAER